uniref:Uncharacterized protein n=1 Tax=Arundo donax TaxID=35708 RepID=A0A0A9CAG8_ARUDO
MKLPDDGMNFHIILSAYKSSVYLKAHVYPLLALTMPWPSIYLV